jgi:hypothetical protein
MSLARLVVTAVKVEGRSKAEVARSYAVSARWVYELCRRFDAEGEAALEPRSRRPRSSPNRTPEALEDEIVELRKDLLDLGLDAGAQTIAVHLRRRHPDVSLPSTATIWRIRRARQPVFGLPTHIGPTRGRGALADCGRSRRSGRVLGLVSTPPRGRREGCDVPRIALRAAHYAVVRIAGVSTT